MANNPNLLSALAQRMDWLGQRQHVLSNNIANADTPKFKARDLDEAAFLRALTREMGQPLRPTATHGAHMTNASLESRSGAKTGELRGTYESSPTGNSVVLEEQLILMNQVQADHNMMTRLYKKQVDMIKMALRGAR